MLKVITLIGTRPELIKLSCVLPLLDQTTKHIVVHTGQNYDYELNEIFYRDFGLRAPDHYLNASDPNVANAIANIIVSADEIFDKENPDALLVYGDTNSCLAVLSAKRRKIPIFHLEAGNRCFDMRVPEEINRKVVDHLSDVNMTHSEHARRYLISEGLRPELVFKTGSPMKEIIDKHRERIDASNILKSLKLERDEYFVVSCHREENVDNAERLSTIIKGLQFLSDKYSKEIVFSVHPRTRARIIDLGLDLNNLNLIEPLGFFDYLKLQSQSSCVISDSGTITEEASLLDFCAITIRETHERPEGTDAGILIMSAIDPESMSRSVQAAMSLHENKSLKVIVDIPDYDVDNFSSKVVKIILSYTDYVNRVVWSK